MQLTFRPTPHTVMRFLCGIGLLVCAAAWVEYRVAAQAKLAQAQQAQAAQAPFTVPFQGRLLRPDGAAVEVGERKVLFSIYTTRVGSTAIWSSGEVPIDVKPGGYFATRLVGTAANPLSTIDYSQELVVGVKIDDPTNEESTDNEPELLPRLPLQASLYAHQAGTAATLAGLTKHDLSPPGSVVAYAGTVAPRGWLLCDGSLYSKAEYSLLGAVLGSTYGGDGDRLFRVPDLRQRFPMGKSSSGVGSQLGETGGSIDHTHKYIEVPRHSHSIDPPKSDTDLSGKHVHDENIYRQNMGSGGNPVMRPSPPAPGSETPNWQTLEAGEHKHAIDIGAFESAQAGIPVATTEGSNPPYLAISYIIRT